MRIADFDRAKHFWMLCEWMRAHDIVPPSIDMLSDVGLVAYVGLEAIATLHVYCTESAFAYLDLVCVRPKRSKFASKALAALFDEAAKVAASRGCTRLVGYTPHRGLARAAQRHGWTVLDVPQTLIMRGL